MSDKEYLDELWTLLGDLPDQERKDAVFFVEEYLEEAREMGIADPRSSLGTPQEYARTIREGLNGSIPPVPPVPDHGSDSDISRGSDLAGGSPRRSQTPLPLAVRILLILAGPFAAMFAIMVLFILFCFLFVLIMLFFALLMVAFSFVLSVVLLMFKAVTLIFTDPLGAVFDLGLVLIFFSVLYPVSRLVRLVFRKGAPWVWRMLKSILMHFYDLVLGYLNRIGFHLDERRTVQ